MAPGMELHAPPHDVRLDKPNLLHLAVPSVEPNDHGSGAADSDHEQEDVPPGWGPLHLHERAAALLESAKAAVTSAYTSVEALQAAGAAPAIMEAAKETALQALRAALHVQELLSDLEDELAGDSDADVPVLVSRVNSSSPTAPPPPPPAAPPRPVPASVLALESSSARIRWALLRLLVQSAVRSADVRPTRADRVAALAKVPLATARLPPLSFITSLFIPWRRQQMRANDALEKLQLEMEEVASRPSDPTCKRTKASATRERRRLIRLLLHWQWQLATIQGPAAFDLSCLAKVDNKVDNKREPAGGCEPTAASASSWEHSQFSYASSAWTDGDDAASSERSCSASRRSSARRSRSPGCRSRSPSPEASLRAGSKLSLKAGSQQQAARAAMLGHRRSPVSRRPASVCVHAGRTPSMLGQAQRACSASAGDGPVTSAGFQATWAALLAARQEAGLAESSAHEAALAERRPWAEEFEAHPFD